MNHQSSLTLREPQCREDFRQRFIPPHDGLESQYVRRQGRQFSVIELFDNVDDLQDRQLIPLSKHFSPAIGRKRHGVFHGSFQQVGNQLVELLGTGIGHTHILRQHPRAGPGVRRATRWCHAAARVNPTGVHRPHSTKEVPGMTIPVPPINYCRRPRRLVVVRPQGRSS